jgi:hypothetical protein
MRASERGMLSKMIEPIMLVCCMAIKTHIAYAQMTCADVAATFDRADLREIRAVTDYELKTWREMDSMAASVGKPTLLGQMSREALISNLSMIGGWCRANPDEALPEAVKDIYAMMRRIYNLYD